MHPNLKEVDKAVIPKEVDKAVIPTADDLGTLSNVNTEQTSSSSSYSNYLDYALWVCYCSILLSLAFGVAGLKIGIDTNSSSTITYALEVLADLTSSALVAWRFLVKGSEIEANTREIRGSIGIAFAFIAVAIISSSVAIHELLTDESLEEADEIVTLHLISCFVMFPLAGVKFHIASVLTSSSLKLDAINTLAVAIMSVGVLTVTELEEWNGNLWFFDEALTLVC